MSPTTFHEMEKARWIAAGGTEQSPLSDWYARVRDVPLSAFGVGDLCKSLRQGLYPEYVVPFALEAFEKEPLAGEMYDGELAMAFCSVLGAFWRNNPRLAVRVIRVLGDVFDRLGEDLKPDVARVIAEVEGLEFPERNTE
jgi:hypothetical protein